MRAWPAASRRARLAAGGYRIALLLVCGAVVAALAGCGAGQAAAGNPEGARSSTAAPAAPRTPPVNMHLLTDPAAGKYFGVEPDGRQGSLRPVQAFAELTGRKPDLIGYYIGWNTSFDAAAAKSAWAYGALYYMAWEPFNTTVASIASGTSNSYISHFARQVKAAGVPVALSFGHEMNGNWYPWGSSHASPASFVAAWRLIHAVFAAVGATNVIWIWNPNVISAAPVPLQPYYPGNSYVNWIGLTGYFPASGSTTFAGLFGPTMTEIRQFTRKPFIVVETAVQTGPDDVTCAANLVRGVTRRSDVLGLVWFEYDKAGVDWSLADRPAVREAVARGLRTLDVIDVRRA